MDFSHVAIGLVTHAGPKRDTGALISQLVSAGASFREVQHADVYLARNLLLSAILDDESCRERRVVLMLDHDNVASMDALGRLCNWHRTDISPHPLRCAPYPQANGQLAAAPLREHPRPKLYDAWTPGPFWEAGLGLAAVRRSALEAVAPQLASFRYRGITARQWCWGGVVNGEWCADDASFCMHFGGAVLDHTVAGAHIKEVPIQPDPESLRRLRDDAPLVNDAPARMIGKP